MNELEFYNKAKNWDFSMINYEKESDTPWNMYDILKNEATSTSVILDLGTAAGEKVLKYFPECEKIIGTDFSEEMIENANKNLIASGKKNIEFRVMNSLKLDFPNDTFDIVVARHTIIDARQIYRVLKKGGLLIVRGVDQKDCWNLKEMFGRGQAFKDPKSISSIDYDNIIMAGFNNTSLVFIPDKEYYKTKEDLMMLLYKTPILNDFSEIKENDFSEEIIDEALINEYIKKNQTEKGILLKRMYYGITARK